MESGLMDRMVNGKPTEKMPTLIKGNKLWRLVDGEPVVVRDRIVWVLFMDDCCIARTKIRAKHLLTSKV